jgi:hypothetical protein
MQISIKVKSGEAVTRLKLTPNSGKEIELSTPLRIWRDMRMVPAVGGKILRRWKARRSRETFTGLPTDEGPKLSDGDEVTFVVTSPGR